MKAQLAMLAIAFVACNAPEKKKSARDAKTARTFKITDQVGIKLATVNTMIEVGDTAGAIDLIERLRGEYRATPEAIAVIDRREGELAHVWKAYELSAPIRARADKERLREMKKSLDAMTKKVDEFDGITWWHPPAAGKVYGNYIYLYIAKTTRSAPHVRLRVQTRGGDWLFARSAEIKVGELKYELSKGEEWKRDHSGGSTWEYVDRPADANDLQVLSMVDDPSTIVRFKGEKSSRDMELGPLMMESLRITMEAFQVLGGDINNP